jgi:RND family efflux transporter MFP subunit
MEGNRTSGIPARILIGLALMGLSLSGCGKQAQAPQGQSAPPVTVAQPLAKKITDWDEYTGRFTAVQSVELRARVSGYLDSIKFTDGQLVDKGQLLFVIDPRPFQATLDKARADLKVEESRRDLAQLDLARAVKLLAARAVSQEEYDTRAQTQAQTQAAVASAAAAVRNAELDLEFTEIRAPFAGRIGDRKIDIGNLVTGGAGGATLLATIVTQDPIYFEFDGSEADYLKYVRLATAGTRPSSRDAPNQVMVKLMDEAKWTHTGRMNFVDNQLDPNSGTVRGRAVLANPGSVFQPGMFGRLRLIGSGQYDALLVPDESIVSDQATKLVMVIAEDGTVTPRPVELGPKVDGLRVIKSGIAATDKVVISGLTRARPGSKVSPQDGKITAVPDAG